MDRNMIRVVLLSLRSRLALLRSTTLCASIMLKQGVSAKAAQARLGHADIQTTLNIYSHVLPTTAKDAADKIGELVFTV